MADLINDDELIKILHSIPGGYEYLGACSTQLCFPLRKGGELRFMYVDDDVDDDPVDETKTVNVKGKLKVDFYDGALPPCITGFSKPTGAQD